MSRGSTEGKRARAAIAKIRIHRPVHCESPIWQKCVVLEVLVALLPGISKLRADHSDLSFLYGMTSLRRGHIIGERQVGLT
jgi:ATP-dependent phosphoenolpyruvate carboxykinase